MRSRAPYPITGLAPWLLAVLCCCGLALGAHAQRGLGLRFGSDVNHFFRADEHPLVDGWWSQMVFGGYYQAVFQDGGAQVGLNLLYKNSSGKGFPNLPVVMRDWRDTQNVGLTALEMDLRVGPRFGFFNPRIGYQLFYCLKRDGFLEPGDTSRLNRVYVNLPFGLSVEGPTGYGSVGFGVYYNVGLNNVIKAPTPGLRDYDGSKFRGLRIELTILFNAGEQKERHPVKVYDPETGEEIDMEEKK